MRCTMIYLTDSGAIGFARVPPKDAVRFWATGNPAAVAQGLRRNHTLDALSFNEIAALISLQLQAQGKPGPAA